MVRIDVRKAVSQERLRAVAAKRGESVNSTGGVVTGEQDVAADGLDCLRDKLLRLKPIAVQATEVATDRIQGLHYISNFLDADEELAIVNSIDNVPQGRWISAGERRMLNFGGWPGQARVAEALPGFAELLVKCLVAAGLYTPETAPNHLLINDYRGSAGIPPHRDGPLYNNVITITLSGPALLSLHKAVDEATPGELVTEVLLRERCLLMLSGEAYSDCLHSITPRPTDTVGPNCCNAALEGINVGQEVPRAPRRISLVFVHKKA